MFNSVAILNNDRFLEKCENLCALDVCCAWREGWVRACVLWRGKQCVCHGGICRKAPSTAGGAAFASRQAVARPPHVSHCVPFVYFNASAQMAGAFPRCKTATASRCQSLAAYTRYTTSEVGTDRGRVRSGFRVQKEAGCVSVCTVYSAVATACVPG